MDFPLCVSGQLVEPGIEVVGRGRAAGSRPSARRRAAAPVGGARGEGVRRWSRTAAPLRLVGGQRERGALAGCSRSARAGSSMSPGSDQVGRRACWAAVDRVPGPAWWIDGRAGRRRGAGGGTYAGRSRAGSLVRRRVCRGWWRRPRCPSRPGCFEGVAEVDRGSRRTSPPVDHAEGQRDSWSLRCLREPVRDDGGAAVEGVAHRDVGQAGRPARQRLGELVDGEVAGGQVFGELARCRCVSHVGQRVLCRPSQRDEAGSGQAVDVQAEHQPGVGRAALSWPRSAPASVVGSQITRSGRHAPGERHQVERSAAR